jgi:alkanesulfonate monooxygenase SsuD/methylene tetrahydromethanopterin reductase-like flavin-dependent oxidoreductase (luciferase family)
MMPLHPPDRPHWETYDEDLALVALADGLGIKEAWIGEHFLLPWENMPSPELFIARALGVTENMAFGTGVSLLHFHHPIHVAHRIAMLDHLAKGRLYFGIGAGGGDSDLEMFDIDTEAGSLRERMMECVEAIIRLWDEGPFDHDGRFFKIRRPEDRSHWEVGFHMMPYQQPHPPIAVAGTSPRSETLELAGERGWIPMSGGLVHPSFLADTWGSVERGAERSGLKPSRADWRVAREVYIAEDSNKAREDAMNGPFGRDFVQYWQKLIGNGPRGLDIYKVDPEMPDEAVTPEYMMENFWIVGDPEECTEKIRKVYEDSGGFGTLLVQTSDWGRDTNKAHRSLELLAKEVLPGLPDLGLWQGQTRLDQPAP